MILKPSLPFYIKTGLLALSLALASCTIYIVNGSDGRTLMTSRPLGATKPVANSVDELPPAPAGLMNDIKNSKSGLYAIVNGTTLIHCNEYYQPHNLPEDPPIPIIPPEKDEDYKYIMNALTTSISQKTTTISNLRSKLQNEYHDVLQACLDSQ